MEKINSTAFRICLTKERKSYRFEMTCWWVNDRNSLHFNFTFLYGDFLVMASHHVVKSKISKNICYFWSVLSVFYPSCLNPCSPPQPCLLFLWSSSRVGGGLETRCHNPFITLNISPLAFSCSLAPSLSSLIPPAFLCRSPSLSVS